MRKPIFFGVLLLGFISASTLPSQPTGDKAERVKALNQKINAAVYNAAMLGYNVGKIGGSAQDVTRLVNQVFNGNTNALVEWANTVAATNHSTAALIVR